HPRCGWGKSNCSLEVRLAKGGDSSNGQPSTSRRILLPKTRSLTPRMISEFCRLRLKSVLVDGEIELMANYLVGLLEIMAYPPYRGSGIDWTSLADVTGIGVERLKAARLQIKPVLDAVARSVGVQERDAPLRPESNQEPSTHKRSAPKERARRGPAPKSIVEFPEPLFTEWDD